MEKIIIKNRKAYHDYTITDKIEAGLQLTGSEVKSIREGKVNIKEAYCAFKDNELYLIQAHISSYSHIGYGEHDPLRGKKLLLHKKELLRLRKKRDEQSCTVVPLCMYWKDNHIKLEIGLGKGKKTVDKRQDIAKRDAQRQLDRQIKNRD